MTFTTSLQQQQAILLIKTSMKNYKEASKCSGAHVLTVHTTSSTCSLKNSENWHLGRCDHSEVQENKVQKTKKNKNKKTSKERIYWSESVTKYQGDKPLEEILRSLEEVAPDTKQKKQKKNNKKQKNNCS